MLTRLRNALRTRSAAPLPSTAQASQSGDDVRARLTALEARTHALERGEALRSAEHSAMLDKLDRLYKRVSARISREGNGAVEGESPLALRNRIRGV